MNTGKYAVCSHDAYRSRYCLRVADDCGRITLVLTGRPSGGRRRKGETWDRLLHQGIHLLERFAQDNRVCVRDPHQNLQIKTVRHLSGGSEFVVYLDAVGETGTLEPRNVNLALIKQALGHKGIASVSIFTEPTDETAGKAGTAALASLF
jgi:hypothetical protein